MGTLTEKHRLDHESQSSDRQLFAGQQSTDQDTKEGLSQEDIPDATCSITSELKTHDDESEEITTTTLDIAGAKTKGVEINQDYLETENATVEDTDAFYSQNTGNGSLGDALSVHKSKDINRTVDIDEINRTIDTSGVIRSVDTGNACATLDTSDLIWTADKSDTSRTLDPVDTSNMGLNANAIDKNRTVDTSDETRPVGSSADTSGTVDTSATTQTAQEII